MNAGSQTSLFDSPGLENQKQATAARERRQAMIGRLKAAEAPCWRDEAAVFLDDGAFQRAMRLVPAPEAAALGAEFDAEMERLYAVWASQRNS